MPGWPESRVHGRRRGQGAPEGERGHKAQRRPAATLDLGRRRPCDQVKGQPESSGSANSSPMCQETGDARSRAGVPIDRSGPPGRTRAGVGSGSEAKVENSRPRMDDEISPSIPAPAPWSRALAVGQGLVRWLLASSGSSLLASGTRPPPGDQKGSRPTAQPSMTPGASTPRRNRACDLAKGCDVRRDPLGDHPPLSTIVRGDRRRTAHTVDRRRGRRADLVQSSLGGRPRGRRSTPALRRDSTKESTDRPRVAAAVTRSSRRSSIDSADLRFR
jgi:hypothetical protein